jgi:uncharacterized protein (TIGR02118 family)
MFKVLILTRRKPEISRAAFERHLREIHLPLVARLPGLRRLVVNTPVPSPDGAPPAWDAIGEDWFDSLEAWQRALASPAGQAVFADGARFSDMAGSQFLSMDEQEVDLSTARAAGTAVGTPVGTPAETAA